MLTITNWLARLRHWWLRFIGAAHTKGFTPYALTDHFVKHGNDFGVTSEATYEALADAFLGGPRRAGVLECNRPDTLSGVVGDRCRFDCSTQEFGVLSVATGYIRSYYKPQPLMEHVFPTNAEYFCDTCQRRFP